MDKSLKNKCVILLFTALFTLISSCATTPPGQPIDLNGMWTVTYEHEGCPNVWASYPETVPAKITQQGSRIKILFILRKITTLGILKDNIIAFKGGSFPSRSGGINSIQDFNYILSEDRKKITGTMKWSYADSKGGPIRCTGTTKVILKREPKK